MKRIAPRVLVGALVLLLVPVANATNNDCCFDLNLLLIGGYYQCVSEPSKASCFARTGLQIWAEDYGCDNVSQNVCRLKSFDSDSCQIYEGGKPEDRAC